MVKRLFLGGRPLMREDLDAMQTNISDAVRNYSKSRYGRVVEGLDLSFNPSTRLLSVSRGVGFSKGGEFIEAKGELEYTLEDYTYNNGKNTIMIFLKKQNSDVILHFFFYTGFLVTDPFALPWVDERNRDDELIVGMILGSSLYSLNREEQEPTFPVGSICLYTRDYFKNYITLRGCRIANECLGRFIKFDSTAKRKGGRYTVKLTASNIPSIAFKGVTDSAGRHKHGGVYTYCDLMKGFYVDEGYMTDGWYDTQWDPTDESDSHSHRFNAEYKNPNPTAIILSPMHRVYVPILREY